jgi:hypothetical protein
MSVIGVLGPNALANFENLTLAVDGGFVKRVAISSPRLIEVVAFSPERHGRAEGRAK